MRLNLGVPLRALQERLDAVENECRLLASLKTEEQDQIAHLQSRLHALAQAVSELPEVFQEALKEVAAQQARVEANVELTRQSMRDHRHEVHELHLCVPHGRPHVHNQGLCGGRVRMGPEWDPSAQGDLQEPAIC